MKLSDYAQIVAYDIAFWLTALRNPAYPLQQLGEVCIDAQAKLRTAAIIALLSKGDADTFSHNLVRSGRCRVTYLQRVQASGGSEHHDASSRIEPFFDAVAAADFALARQIAALSPREWRRGHEYEDDFCHAQLAFAVIAPAADVARTEALFERWEQVLDGQPDARLPVLRALARRDGAAFEPAFEALLDAHAAQIQAERERARIEEPGLIAGWQLWVDGLALLRMATQLKLPTQDEYRWCPSLARQVSRVVLPAEW
jgi:hypothetical protein